MTMPLIMCGLCQQAYALPGKPMRNCPRCSCLLLAAVFVPPDPEPSTSKEPNA